MPYQLYFWRRLSYKTNLALDMQPHGCVHGGMGMDVVFKALADASRRQLLDSLHARNGQTLAELCGQLKMTRQAVTKHLTILEDANLVATLRRGREKVHYLNPIPINEIADRWIGKYEHHRVRVLVELKKILEKKTDER